MDKRLSRSDYIFTLFFIFMLVVAVGAFFYGLRTGIQKTTAKYEQAKALNAKNTKPTAYQQQVLVSFYDTIYQPARQFQNNWFKDSNEIKLHSAEVDNAVLFKQLNKSADNAFQNIQSISVPATSPLLVEAEDDYLKSLKLFSTAFGRFAGKVPSSPDLLDKKVKADPYFQQAFQYWLSAQDKFYQSIVQWNLTVEPHLKGIALLTKADLTYAQWIQLNLNEKDQYVAGLMRKSGYFKPYDVQDATLRIDDFVHAGEAGKLHLDKIKDTLDMLVAANAIRSGDYLAEKNKYYSKETLPLLPYFFSP